MKLFGSREEVYYQFCEIAMEITLEMLLKFHGNERNHMAIYRNFLEILLKFYRSSIAVLWKLYGSYMGIIWQLPGVECYIETAVKEKQRC